MSAENVVPDSVNTVNDNNEEYQKKLSQVISTVISAITTNPPALSSDYPGINTFNNLISEAKLIVAQWASQCLAPLYLTPSKIDRNKNDASNLINVIYDMSRTLVTGDVFPASENITLTPQQQIYADIDNLKNILSSFVSDINNILNNTGDINNKLPPVINQLNQLLNMFSSIEKVELDILAAYRAEIENLKEDIALDMAEINIDSTINQFAPAFLFSMAVTPITSVVATVVFIGSMVHYCFDVNKFKDDVVKLVSTESQMQSATSDAAKCFSILDNLTQLIGKIEDANSNLSFILKSWQDIEDSINSVIGYIDQAKEDGGEVDRSKLSSVLKNASDEWSNAVKLLNGLKINWNFSSANITGDMTTEQIGAEINKASNHNLSDYFLQFNPLN